MFKQAPRIFLAVLPALETGDGCTNTDVLTFVQLVDDYPVLVHAEVLRPPKQSRISNGARIITPSHTELVEDCWS